MGQGIEVVNAYLAAAASTAAQAMTAGAGQSFSVRAAAGQSPITLEGLWANATVISDIRVRSPRLHDDVQAIRGSSAATDPRPSLLEAFTQPLYSQDLLVVEDIPVSAPGAGAVQGAGLLIRYDDVPGISANLRSWSEVAPNIESYYSQEASPVSGATAGDWGPGVAINSTYDVLKANRLYAILGYTVQSRCTSIAVQGVDTGNLLAGGPGCIDPMITRQWFVYNSLETGKPMIPVINSANKSATLVNVAHPTASTTVVVNLLMALLSN